MSDDKPAKNYNVYQISLPAEFGMFTLRAETYDEFVAELDLVTLGNSDKIIARIIEGFRRLAGGPPAQATAAPQGTHAAPPATVHQGNGYSADGKVAANEERFCPGHGVLMEYREGTSAKGPWKGYFCGADVAKDSKCSPSWVK